MFCYCFPTPVAGTRVMRRSSATFVLAVFLLGTIASVDAFARGGGGRGGHGGRGHHASGHAFFFRSAPRTAVVVTAPVIYGGFRAPYYPPVYGYSAGPYYSGAPYYPAVPYDPSAPYYPAPYSPPEYIEQGQDQPAPPSQPGPQQQPGAQQQPAPYWFCPAANNYYPFVRTCPSWQPVAP